MASWSRLLASGGQKLFKPDGLFMKVVPKNDSVRCMSEDRKIPMIPTRWQWHKTKDLLHFYFFVGAIPVAIVIFCANVFVGPATLEPIPDGYEPKRWEYYRSPITRFFSRYLCPNRQQEYEKYLHHLVHNYEIKKLKEIHALVRENIRYHQDYPAFAYKKSVQATFVKEYKKRLDTQGLA